MTMDYCKGNQVVAPTANAVADLVSFLEQINVATTQVHAVWAIDLASAFFPIPIRRETEKQLAFM